MDSLFTSGEYVAKAYTNWIKNFNEQNLFVESIKVIDPKVEQFIKPKVVENEAEDDEEAEVEPWTYKGKSYLVDTTSGVVYDEETEDEIGIRKDGELVLN